MKNVFCFIWQFFIQPSIPGLSHILISSFFYGMRSKKIGTRHVLANLMLRGNPAMDKHAIQKGKGKKYCKLLYA